MLGPLVRDLDPDVDVITFDPPGIGGSAQPPGPYRFTGLCWLIARMLTELGYHGVDVLGISWGGGIAQHFAAARAAAGPANHSPARREGGLGPAAHT